MSVNLPSWHYAAAWPQNEAHKTAAEITELGTRYILADPSEKEQLALELLKDFHNYLAKYVDMIVRGHLPRYGGRVNKDARELSDAEGHAGEQVHADHGV